MIKLTEILKVGLVGCGRIASVAHLPCYQMMPNAKVVAVMDAIEERAKVTARSFRIKKWYNDYRSMLKDEEIEAIDICSPPNAHAEQAIMAAETGKHILCEKPISTNMEDARKLESAVKRAGVTFMTGFAYRFHPLLQKAREAVDKPKLLRISYSFHPTVASDHWIYDISKSGGFLVEQAVHWFDLFRWWSGKATSVYAKAQMDFPFPDIAALISCENDALGVIDYNSNSPLTFFYLTIENSEKSAMIKTGLLPSKWGGFLQIADRNGRQRAYVLSGWGIHKKCRRAVFPFSFILSRFQDSRLVPFYNEIEHFVFSILHGNSPKVSLQDGLESLKVAIATKKSIDQGKEIYL